MERVAAPFSCPLVAGNVGEARPSLAGDLGEGKTRSAMVLGRESSEASRAWDLSTLSPLGAEEGNDERPLTSHLSIYIYTHAYTFTYTHLCIKVDLEWSMNAFPLDFFCSEAFI